MSPRGRGGAANPATEWDTLRRVALVGAATLKGRELKEVLDDRNFPTIDIKLLDDDESLGQLDAVGEEITFIQSVVADNFEGIDFAFFASETDFTRKHWELAQQSGATVIDMSYALEDQPGAEIRSPWIEKELAAGGMLSGDGSSKLQVTAHPAATVLALLLLRARRAGQVRNTVATVFEPASERGRRGMDELHQQTINLLSFQPMPKAVYDSQVAFNLLSRYGPEAARTLESVEQRIARHFQEILRAGVAPGTPVAAGGIATPAVALVQSPTFHAHAFSIYVEFDKPQAVGDFAQALAGEHVTVTQAADESPTNVSAAGQNDVLIAVRRVAQRENAFWIWATADNLKLTAITAVECAESSDAQTALQ